MDAHVDKRPLSLQAQEPATCTRSTIRKALIIATGLWLMFGFRYGWIGWYSSDQGNGHQPNVGLNYGSKPTVPDSEGRKESCAKFSDSSNGSPPNRYPPYKFHSDASFVIPINAGHSFFVHTSGSFATGEILFGLSDSDQVEVAVDAFYQDKTLIDLMNVCYVLRKMGQGGEADASGREPGLVIYTPDGGDPRSKREFEFRVTIRLPSSLPSLHAIEIRADNFAITFDDLTPILIKLLDLSVQNGAFEILKVLAHDVRIRAQNGAVRGFFKVSSTLSLATTNGEVKAQVALFPPRDKTAATSVDVTVVHGVVNLRYVEHPVDQVLLSTVSSNTGKVEVEHAKEFEGDFEVETSIGTTKFVGPLSHDDPKHESRERHITTHEKQGHMGYHHISGMVWWGGKENDSRKRGKTVANTRIGEASLKFD